MEGLSEKQCAKCKEIKSTSEFLIDKQRKDGLYPYCRVCRKINRHNSYIKNPDKVNTYARKWRESHRERVDEAARIWWSKNKKKVDVIKKIFKEKHPGASNEYSKKWKAKNKEMVRATANKCQRIRRQKIKNHLSHRISTYICSCLKGTKNFRSWESLVGYTVEQLKCHLEKKFLPGMSWDNRSEWHIDHKIPVSAFNYETPEDLDFKRCWALKNLRPLWKKENLVKNDNLSRPFQPSLLL